MYQRPSPLLLLAMPSPAPTSAPGPVTAGVLPVMKPFLGPEEAQAAAEAVASGWVAQGPRVAAFEEAIRDRTGGVAAVAVSSCTTALHLSLVLLGIGPGDEVIVPSLSFIATANVVRYTGATVVFADVDLATQNLTVATIAAVLSPATKAVIVVDQCGVPADLDAIDDLCRPLGIAVVEDAACALGSVYKRAPVGGRADLAAFSFHPRKVITTGEGGMLVTSDPEWAARARRLREHGMSMSAADRHNASTVVLERYLETGFNYRMTDVQAAIGLVQLGRLDAIVARRRELAAGYRERLADIPELLMASDPPHGESNFQSFWVLLPHDFGVTRQELLQRLMDAGISARRGIMASHLEPAYRDLFARPLPATEALTTRSVILPLFHTMTDRDLDRVVGVVREAARAGHRSVGAVDAKVGA